MDWQVFRDAKESDLAEYRSLVEQALHWRVPDFHWSAASLREWYEGRSQWTTEIREAVEFLYEYDYPLRLIEEKLVQNESWLRNGYDGLRDKLMEAENRFWMVQAANQQNRAEDTSPSDQVTTRLWWDKVRHRRGPHLLTRRSYTSLEKYLGHIELLSRSNDYGAVGHLKDADHASIQLTPRRFVDVLMRMNPDVTRLLPLTMDFSREQGQLSVTLTDWIGETTWPDNPGDEIIKALAWFDVTAAIFLDGLGWVH